MHEFVNFIVQTVSSWGYAGIFIMMFFESTIIPIPSELAMIPAGYLVSTGDMLFFTAFLAGTLWAIGGSLVNYFAGEYLWAPLVKAFFRNFGKYFFASEKTYLRSEKFFKHHGTITVFTGRFIPGIRHLISIPAGIFKMELSTFILFTTFGAGLWNLCLMGIWYIAWQNQELIKHYSQQLTIGLVIGIIILIWAYVSINSREGKM